MAEAFEVKSATVDGMREAERTFPGLRWRVNRGTKKARIFDEKRNEWVEVTDGDYIVSIGKRFEVSDTEPEKAKPVEAPEPEPEPEPEEEDEEPHDDE